MQQSASVEAAEFRPPPTVPVESYAEVRAAWTCPHFSAALSGPGDELFHKDTVLRLDGAHHLARRRALGELLKRKGHQHFRDAYLYPTATAALAAVLANPDADGVARTDLVEWGRRVNFQLSAMLVGYDKAVTPEGADDLYRVMDEAFKARPGAAQVAQGEFDPNTETVRKGMIARQDLIDRYYTPAITRRREMVAKVRAGEMDESELPQDMLTIVARGVHEDFDDPGVAEREALFLFAAAVHTTAASVVWVLRELFEWFEAHPEDRDTADDTFLLGAVNETLRLHPATPGHPRLALETVELPDGTTVPEGSMAVIMPHLANVDPNVWGPDATEFNPRRVPPPGVKAHGFVFGGGAHMCWGAPLVMGAEGVDGSLVFLTRLLLAEGVAFDPDAPALPRVAETHGVFYLLARNVPSRVRRPGRRLTPDATMPRIKVAEADELAPCALKRVEIDGVALCIARSEGGNLFALLDRCSHEDTPLSEGWVYGEEIECAAHNAVFALATGDAVSLPATEPVQTFNLIAQADGIYVEL